MIANDGMIDPRLQEQNCATLNRKELVSLLKTRYGNDIEKYRSLKKVSKFLDCLNMLTLFCVKLNQIFVSVSIFI